MVNSLGEKNSCWYCLLWVYDKLYTNEQKQIFPVESVHSNALKIQTPEAAAPCHFSICAQRLHYLLPSGCSITVFNHLLGCAFGALLFSGLNPVFFAMVVEEFEDIDVIEKDSYLQGNTTFLLAENSLSSFCESFWYLESIMRANLLGNIQSLRNGRCSADANYIECLFVLCRLYLCSSPRHHPIP